MYEIEITSKKEFKNVKGIKTLSDVLDFGIKNIQKIDYCSLYAIDGDIKFQEAETIASELLSDKITETYKLNRSSYNIPVLDIWYKEGVTDATAESVVKAVRDLNICKKIQVKTGHRYCFYGKMSKASIENIAVKLLANVLIQEYEINLVK
ncbi:MAG: phosphoribosylformylglycinamidine synthase subunit PurS [Elusimicrobiota bacterium]|jgi:phosphoribosylformylglycinamidine synthase|nr:phosphoribosylformylglycinamidine synthase subunit PurS [Elusimicrobiota bacterium]